MTQTVATETGTHEIRTCERYGVHAVCPLLPYEDFQNVVAVNDGCCSGCGSVVIPA